MQKPLGLGERISPNHRAGYMSTIFLFRIGNASRCFGKLEDWLQKKIRRHLYKAKQPKGFGWKRWNRDELYRNTGIYHDYRIKYMR